MSSGDEERSGSCECRGMEEVQGPLLGVECELRVEPETFSFGVEREFGAGPRLSPSGLNESQLVRRVCYLLEALLVRLTHVAFLGSGKILTTTLHNLVPKEGVTVTRDFRSTSLLGFLQDYHESFIQQT